MQPRQSTPEFHIAHTTVTQVTHIPSQTRVQLSTYQQNQPTQDPAQYILSLEAKINELQQFIHFQHHVLVGQEAHHRSQIAMKDRNIQELEKAIRDMTQNTELLLEIKDRTISRLRSSSRTFFRAQPPELQSSATTTSDQPSPQQQR